MEIVTIKEVDAWFVHEVLPLEAPLMRYLARNWRDTAELLDLRQEVYARSYEAACEALPTHTQAFVFAIARNLLIDSVRRARVVAIDSVADLDNTHPIETIDPERETIAREQLRMFHDGLGRLPARCREVVRLRKVEMLSQREVAGRMGISEDTVERQIRHGMRALADFMLGGAGRIQRTVRPKRVGTRSQ